MRWEVKAKARVLTGYDIDSPIYVEVDAYESTTPGLVLHRLCRRAENDGVEILTGWVVTHAPSGKRVGHVQRTRALAGIMAQALEGVVDWQQPEEALKARQKEIEETITAVDMAARTLPKGWKP